MTAIGDFAALRRELEQQGFRVENGQGRRWRVTPPSSDASIVFISPASGSHEWTDVIGNLKRAGYMPGLTSKPALVRPAAPVPASPASAPPAPAAPQEMPTMDALFAALKDARMYLGLVDETVAKAEIALKAVTGELESAKRERAKAEEDLRKAKAAFDAVFNP